MIFHEWLDEQRIAAYERARATYDEWMTSRYVDADTEAKHMIHWAQAQARVQLIAEVRRQYIESGAESRERLAELEAAS